MEIQLLQMKRLHQMQDEYLQCLSRNDELLVENDKVLQVMLCCWFSHSVVGEYG